MTCKNCGASLVEGNDFCPNCGSPVVEGLIDNGQEESAKIPVDKKYSGKSIAGFVLSLVGILVAAIPCGIIGLVLASLAMKEVELPQYKGKSLATSALVISILDIVFGVIFLAM